MIRGSTPLIRHPRRAVLGRSTQAVVDVDGAAFRETWLSAVEVAAPGVS